MGPLPLSVRTSQRPLLGLFPRERTEPGGALAKLCLKDRTKLTLCASSGEPVEPADRSQQAEQGEAAQRLMTDTPRFRGSG